MKRFAKTLILSSLLGAFALGAQAADTYLLDPSHTSVAWTINHFDFSYQTGKFANIEGTLTIDETKPENSKVIATIAIVNLVTGVPLLDEHLKSEKFFDMAKFPLATFASDRVEVTGRDTAKVYGGLTVHGILRPVMLDVKLNKIGDNIMKKKTAGFSATVTIKRSDFGMNTYVPMLGDEVKLVIASEANLAPQSPAPAKAVQ